MLRSPHTTARLSMSTPVTSASITEVLAFLLRIARIGEAMSAGERTAVADLIEQGLEEVIVVPIHERHVDGRPRQCLGGRQPAEPCAADHDVRPPGRSRASCQDARPGRNTGRLPHR